MTDRELRAGYFGEFGGRFVAETLVPALVELELELDGGHYHVPLLVSPFSCASYRGS